MATFTEMRSEFIAEQVAKINASERMTRVAMGKPNALAEYAWRRHIEPIMREAVRTGRGLPAPEPVDLQLSADFGALPNIGGVIVQGHGGFRVTVECETRRSWVLVQRFGQYTAMTVEQAFRLGLSECEWPE